MRKSFLFFLVTAMLGFSACTEQINEPNEQFEEFTQLEMRAEDVGNFAFLVEFQGYLRTLNEGGQAENVYSAEKAIYGVEFLLNLRYATISEGIPFDGGADEFSIPTNSNWLDLFQQAEKIVKQAVAKAENGTDELLAYEIYLSKATEGELRIGTKTKFKKTDQCMLQHYTSSVNSVVCDPPFEQGESYYTWLLGFEGYEPYDGLDCLNECGGVAACNTVTNFAFEEIENHLNVNVPDPECPAGMVFLGTYSDIQTGGWAGSSDYAADFDCDFFNNEQGWLTPCTCMEADLLNCIYCTMWDDIMDNTSGTIQIPAGYSFIAINMGTNAITYQEDSSTRLEFTYTYGIPNCGPGIVWPPVVEEALYMQLSEWYE